MLSYLILSYFLNLWCRILYLVSQYRHVRCRYEYIVTVLSSKCNSTVQNSAGHCRTLQGIAGQCRTILCRALQDSAREFRTILHSAAGELRQIRTEQGISLECWRVHAGEGKTAQDSAGYCTTVHYGTGQRRRTVHDSTGQRETVHDGTGHRRTVRNNAEHQ